MKQFLIAFIATLTVILLLYALATECHADRWRSKRIQVLDYTHRLPVAEAAQRWDDATVINPVVIVGGYTSDAPYIAGAVTVYRGDYGSSLGYAATSLVRGRHGFITAARTVVNTYWRPFTPDEEMYLLVHELGHAFASLPHSSRSTSVMGGYALFPDAGDIASMNAAYGR